MSCSAPGCNNCQRLMPRQSEVSFFQFPTAPALLNKWLINLNLKKDQWTWSKNKKVCSNHFDKNDYIVTGQRRYVKPDAVPFLIDKKVLPGSSRYEYDATITVEDDIMSSTSGEIIRAEKRPSDIDAWDDEDRPINIKNEPEDNDDKTDIKPIIKQEIKKEIKQEPADKPIEIKIKKEQPDESFEEGELEDSILAETDDKKHVRLKNDTPPKLQSYDPSLPVDKMFDESPFNKDMFKTLRMKDETPVKNECEDVGKRTLKSAKRTVFNSRHSPYKKFEHNSEDSKDKESVKSRLVLKGGNDKQPKMKKKQENLVTCPEILSRREKQIEYGKNTIGYENYIKMVPKAERKPEDPQTPPRYKEYSRRGWEGLVKQWRIRLHKYDPPETNDDNFEDA